MWHAIAKTFPVLTKVNIVADLNYYCMDNKIISHILTNTTATRYIHCQNKLTIAKTNEHISIYQRMSTYPSTYRD